MWTIVVRPKLQNKKEHPQRQGQAMRLEIEQ